MCSYSRFPHAHRAGKVDPFSVPGLVYQSEALLSDTLEFRSDLYSYKYNWVASNFPSKILMVTLEPFDGLASLLEESCYSPCHSNRNKLWFNGFRGRAPLTYRSKM